MVSRTYPFFKISRESQVNTPERRRLGAFRKNGSTTGPDHTMVEKFTRFHNSNGTRLSIQMIEALL